MSEWTMDEELRVIVDGVDTAGPRSTVAVGMGTATDGRRVVFAGSSREMHRLQLALESGVAPVASVPRWAVLTASLPPEPAA